MSDTPTNKTTVRLSFSDRLACWLGIWALRQLYGADCEIDIRDEFPGEDVHCIGCDATRLVANMKWILEDS